MCIQFFFVMTIGSHKSNESHLHCSSEALRYVVLEEMVMLLWKVWKVIIGWLWILVSSLLASNYSCLSSCSSDRDGYIHRLTLIMSTKLELNQIGQFSVDCRK